MKDVLLWINACQRAQITESFPKHNSLTQVYKIDSEILQFKKISLADCKTFIYYCIFTDATLSCILESFHGEVFASLHNLSYHVIRITSNLILSKFLPPITGKILGSATYAKIHS